MISQLLLLVVITLMVIYTIYYIRDLKTCICFKENDKLRTNLEFLEFYEYLELFALLLVFAGAFSLNTKMFKVGGKKFKKGTNMMAGILMGVVIVIYFMIKYNVMVNVYKLYNGIREECACASKWQRWFLYYQGLVGGLEVLQYVIAFLMLLMVVVTSLFR